MGQAFLVKLGTASFWGILGTASFWGRLGTGDFVILPLVFVEYFRLFIRLLVIFYITVSEMDRKEVMKNKAEECDGGQTDSKRLKVGDKVAVEKLMDNFDTEVSYVAPVIVQIT